MRAFVDIHCNNIMILKYKDNNDSRCDQFGVNVTNYGMERVRRAASLRSIVAW